MTRDTHPLFTVIIPTKDRAEYLHHTLRTCALQDYENLEVIVSDDGSTDHTRAVVEEAARKDPRIRYVTPGVGVGMRDNFEFALEQVKPGYVMALGGDDGLLPYGISGMRNVLLETGLELLTWAAPVYSYPPNSTLSGQLILDKKSKSKIISSGAYLSRQARDLHYLSDLETPMFYVKGIVSTKLIDKVRDRTIDKRFYSCPTPDGYSGIVLAGEVEKFTFSGEPFSLFGASPSSQGIAYLSNSKSAKNQSEAFFKQVTGTPMHSKLARQPYSPLITLMTVDYLLSSQDLPGWPGQVPTINFKKMLEKGLIELSHGLYAEERIIRELNILNNIAEFHGLGEYFKSQVKQSRKYASKAPFEGGGLSLNKIFLNDTKCGIFNIFDAAHVAYFSHKMISQMSLGAVYGAFSNSVEYKLRSIKKRNFFPDQSLWT